MVKLLLGRVTAARPEALWMLEMCSGQLKLMSSKQPSVSGKNWGHAVLPPKVTFGAQYPPASSSSSISNSSITASVGTRLAGDIRVGYSTAVSCGEPADPIAGRV